MNNQEIVGLRKQLGLNQTQFANLMGVHPITVSRWERGEGTPTPYQLAFLNEFQRAADLKAKQLREELKGLMIGAGIAAAVLLLLNAAKKGR